MFPNYDKVKRRTPSKSLMAFCHTSRVVTSALRGSVLRTELSRFLVQLWGLGLQSSEQRVLGISDLAF